jgi:glycerol kinase
MTHCGLDVDRRKSMTQFIAAIDQGTTSTRCMIFDHADQAVAVDQREHRQ